MNRRRWRELDVSPRRDALTGLPGEPLLLLIDGALKTGHDCPTLLQLGLPPAQLISLVLVLTGGLHLLPLQSVQPHLCFGKLCGKTGNLLLLLGTSDLEALDRRKVGVGNFANFPLDFGQRP